MTDSTATPAEATRALGRALMDTLATGWSRGRVDTMMEIFTPEAVFIETPFSTPLSGVQAIREWASEIPYYQSEARFTTGEIYAAGPWFSTEFKLVFQRRTTGERVEARGALFAETDGALVTELRMYWHRWNGGRDTSLP